MNITDIHSHMLFGIDDGAKTLEDSLAMLQAAYDSGTRTVFFTPHNVKAGFDFEKAKESMDALAPIIKERFAGLRVYGGCEIMYSHSITESLITNQLPTLAGSRYVLIEFMPGIFYSEILSAIRKIVSCGYFPIIAHAERCINLKVQNVGELIECGALIQLNAASVLGKRGFAIKRFCAKLIKKSLVHFIASDAHDFKKRTSELGPCAQYITKKYGEQTALELFCRGGEEIINSVK